MARGKARFSGYTQANVGDVSKKVDAAIRLVVPALVATDTVGDNGDTCPSFHPDYLALVEEIRAAAWLARSMLDGNRLENAVPDVKAELSELLRLIERSQASRISEASISHDVWWFISTSLDGVNQSITQLLRSQEGISVLRCSIETALRADLTARPKQSDANMAAARLLVARFVDALRPYRELLGITLTAYHNEDYDRSSTLIKLLAAVGESVGIFHSKAHWRHIVMKEVGSSSR